MDVNGFEKTFEKLAVGRLDRARNSLKPSIEAKNPDAMFLLGRIRWEGRSTATANEEAFKYFKEAAKLGHVYGKLYAAVAYHNGIGVAKNRRTGLRWLADCAGRECAVATLELAVLYLEADGVDYDMDKAIKYLTQAASLSGKPYKGSPRDFAYCTNLQEFIESNESEAIAKAQEYLAYLHSGAEENVARNPTMAAKWAAKALANGFSELVWPLIELHQELSNTDEAKVLLLGLVRKNDARAMYELARIFEKSSSKEEQGQVYRLDSSARKGGYRILPVRPRSVFPLPTIRHSFFLETLDDSAWQAKLEEARQYSSDDPYQLKLKVRILHILARSGCEEAKPRLEALISSIGKEKYLEIINPKTR
jgi:TPR repeat protein